MLVFEIAIVILPIFKKRKGNFEAINWISHRPIVRTCKNRLCWPKTKRLSSSSPAKMSLLGISRELQRRVCNHGKPPGSSHKPGERVLFHRKEVNFQRTLVSKKSMTFTGCILCRKGEESFFFLLGFAIVISMRGPPFLFSKLYLIEVCVLLTF